MEKLKASSVIIIDKRPFSFSEILSATVQACCFPFTHFTLISAIHLPLSTCWKKDFIYQPVTSGKGPAMVPVHLPGVDTDNWSVRQPDYRNYHDFWENNFYYPVTSFKIYLLYILSFY